MSCIEGRDFNWQITKDEAKPQIKSPPPAKKKSTGNQNITSMVKGENIFSEEKIC